MDSGQQDRASRLTKRELSVLERVLRGESNKEIANGLTCSVKTVEFHVSNILRKLGVSTRMRLAAQFMPAAPEE